MALFVYTICFKARRSKKMWERFDILQALLSTKSGIDGELPAPVIGRSSYWCVTFQVETDDWTGLKNQLHDAGFMIDKIENVTTGQQHPVWEQRKRRVQPLRKKA